MAATKKRSEHTEPSSPERNASGEGTSSGDALPWGAAELTEEYFRRAFDQAPIGAAIVTTEFRFKRVNAELCRITGYSAEELAALTFADLLHPDDEPVDYGMIQQLLGGEREQHQRDKRYLRKDGSSIWTRLSVRVIRDADGTVQHLLGMIEDIDQRKRAEAELDINRKRLELAQRAAGAGIWDWDLVNQQLQWSRELYGLLGLDPDGPAATFETWTSMLHPDDAAQAKERLDRSIAEGVPLNSVYRIVRPDETFRWIHSIGGSTRDADGHALRMSGICIDITRWKQIETMQDFLARTGGGTPEKPFFDLLVEQLAESLAMEFVCVMRLDEGGDTAHSIAVWYDGAIQPPMLRTLPGTPCAEVLRASKGCFDAGVCTSFPDDIALRMLHAESYVGVSLRSHTGEVIGAIAASSRLPLGDRVLAESVLQLTAPRAASEIERQEASSALARSRAEMKAIYDHAPIMLCVVDERRCVLYANPAFTAFTGVTEDDLRGGTACGVFGCFNAHDDPRGCGFGSNCTACDMRHSIEDTFQTGNGHRDIEYNTTLVRGNESRKVSLLGSTALIDTGPNKSLLLCLLDISGRKNMEDALQESNRKFLELADNSPGFIAYVSADTLRYEFVNRMYIEGFGKSREEILGAEVRKVIGEQSFAHARPYIETAAGGTSASYEYTFQMLTGPRWIRVNYNPVRDDSGRVVYIVVLGLDITEAKRLEEALRESERRYRKLFDQANEGLVILTREGKVWEVNHAFAEMHGYAVDEIRSMDISDLNVDREATMEVRRALEPRINAGEVARFEVEHFHKDGHIFPLAVTSSLISIDGVPLYMAFHQDITERRKTETELRLAKERAETSEALKDAFVANISHEIRTPLNIILGYTNTIAEKYSPLVSEGDRRFFESVERGGERLMRTVDMILNVSRLQSGEFTPKPVDVDIPALLRAVALDHQPLAKKKHLTLSSIDECGSAWLTVDEYCITQAVSNLVHNAIKFTRQGGVELRVYRNEERRLCISCRDSGIGISKEYLPLLFARYSQEHTGYSRPFEGLGLGMSLVREYLALNGATIAVESEQGVGSTFTITFRSGGAAHAHAPSVASTDDELRPAHTGNDRIALVIEDDEMTIDFMQVVLEEQYAIRIARSGPEALQVLNAERIDIILMDISLAGRQTGLELTQEIRQSPAHRGIPIIAVTAHAYDSDRDNCLDAGCDDFIRKPVNTAFLLERMERLLAR